MAQAYFFFNGGFIVGNNYVRNHVYFSDVRALILKGTRLAKGSLSCSVCAAPEFASAMKQFEWRKAAWFDAISQREHAVGRPEPSTTPYRAAASAALRRPGVQACDEIR